MFPRMLSCVCWALPAFDWLKCPDVFSLEFQRHDTTIKQNRWGTIFLVSIGRLFFFLFENYSLLCFAALCSADYCKLKCFSFPCLSTILLYFSKSFCSGGFGLSSFEPVHSAPPVLKTTQKHLVVVTQSCSSSSSSTSSGDQRDSALGPGLNCWHSQVGKGCSHWCLCSGAKLAAWSESKDSQVPKPTARESSKKKKTGPQGHSF